MTEWAIAWPVNPDGGPVHRTPALYSPIEQPAVHRWYTEDAASAWRVQVIQEPQGPEARRYRVRWTNRAGLAREASFLTESIARALLRSIRQGAAGDHDPAAVLERQQINPWEVIDG